MSKQAGLYDQRDGDFEGSSAAFMVDSACISASGLFFGTSPCTPFVGKSGSFLCDKVTHVNGFLYVESASGISEGGKTGLTAIATSFWFFIAIFFSPLLSNLPSWSTGSVLILVGSLMMKNAVNINWDYIGDAVPAFVALAMIPFTCEYWILIFPQNVSLMQLPPIQITSPTVSLLVSSFSSSCTTFLFSLGRSLLDFCRQDGTTSRSLTMWEL